MQNAECKIVFHHKKSGPFQSRLNSQCDAFSLYFLYFLSFGYLPSISFQLFLYAFIFAAGTYITHFGSHNWNTPAPNCGGVGDSKITLFNFVQLVIASFPISVTLSGIVILVSDLHMKNANSPIEVTLSGMVILVSEEQSRNA